MLSIFYIFNYFDNTEFIGAKKFAPFVTRNKN